MTIAVDMGRKATKTNKQTNKTRGPNSPGSLTCILAHEEMMFWPVVKKISFKHVFFCFFSLLAILFSQAALSELLVEGIMRNILNLDQWFRRRCHLKILLI